MGMTVDHCGLAPRWRLALLDLDGTLYRGDVPVAGAGEFVERLRKHGVQPVFFTNNATRTPQQVAERLQAMGIKATPQEVCTAAQAAAHWLRQQVGIGSVVAFIGMEGLREALVEEGLQPVHVRDLGDRAALTVRAAAMGLDRHVTYADLAKFCKIVIRLGRFVLTNPDLALPSADGVEPGNGSFGRLVQLVTGVEPTVTGKPEPYFVEYALRRFAALAQETFIVGDNPRTDIAAGRRAGIYTIRVLTGLSEEAGSDLPEPDSVVRSVADLFLDETQG
jgi:4-nitrophenyl phosphatase